LTEDQSPQDFFPTMTSSFIYIWLLAAIFSNFNALIGAEAHIFAHSLLRLRNIDVPPTATESKLSHSYFPKATDANGPPKDAEISSEQKTITASTQQPINTHYSDGDVSNIALATHQPASGLWRRDDISTTSDHPTSSLLATAELILPTFNGSLLKFNKSMFIQTYRNKKMADRLFDIVPRHTSATSIQLTSITKATPAPSTLQTVVRRHTGDPAAPLPSKDLDNTYARRTVPRVWYWGHHFHNPGEGLKYT